MQFIRLTKYINFIENPIQRMFFKKQKKQSTDIKIDVNSLGEITCILKIDLVSTSKVKNHFIYECSYLDQGQLKTVSIVGENITDVIKVLEPYVNIGKSEQWVSFQLGSEDAIKSRKKQS
tara:strand:+ start:3235 stop:3594 length:360 start_codon:yes stop_codon:yes gene_type:complete